VQLKGGMIFKDGTLYCPHVRAFIMNKLRSPAGYTVLGSASFKYVVDMSQVASPYTVPDGDALVFANKPGASVQCGVGNDVIKVTASNQTVGTGWGRDELDGHDIVQIQADLENITVNLKAPGEAGKVGTKYVIMDGIDATGVSFTDLNGNPLPSYMFPSD